MGIFGFFGKKKTPKDDDAEKASDVRSEKRPSTSARSGDSQLQPPTRPPQNPPQTDTRPPARTGNTLPGQPVAAPPAAGDEASSSGRHAARASATTRKIDEIESAMSSEFVPSRARAARRPESVPAAAAAAGRGDAQGEERHAQGRGNTEGAGQTKPGNELSQEFESTLPSIGMSTEFLLGVEGRHIPVDSLSSQSAQVIEEAAILFADQQTEVVEQMLLGAIGESAPGDDARELWWLLFDLFQITGKRRQFDNLSLDYASRFETSPPSWVIPATAAPAPGSARTGAAPSVPFAGKLDGSIMKNVERAQKIAENSPLLRLEFGRVTEVDPVGCGLLLRLLQKLQQSNHELILAGAPELAQRIRSIIETGRRDETEAPWLLLLELTRALNLEEEFEEISIDYCVTFEVSPPAFVAPRMTLTATRSETRPQLGNAAALAGGANGAELFLLPPVVEGRTDQLFGSLAQFIGANDPAVVDCSALNRIDFTSASQLLGVLAPLAAGGRRIRLEQVNHLVAALFKVIGISDVTRVTARKL